MAPCRCRQAHSSPTMASRYTGTAPRMSMRSCSSSARARRRRRPSWPPLQPAEPVVALVFPVTALVGVGDFHRHHVFRVLETQLGGNTDFHREAVGTRHDLLGELECHLRLRMQRGRHDDGVSVALDALEPDIFRPRIATDALEELRKRRALPGANRTTAFDAYVPGNLRDFEQCV